VQFEDVQQLLGWALQRLPQLQPLTAAGWDHQQLTAFAGEVPFVWSINYTYVVAVRIWLRIQATTQLARVGIIIIQ
jgi:hypothetical protein